MRLAARGAALALVLSAGGAAAQDTLTARTDFLSLHLSTATGAVELRVLDADGGTVHRALAPELRLDDVAQGGYTREGENRARNPRLDVQLEVLGPRAIAVTWRTRDATSGVFELHLLSDDETAYYGTGERFNALNQKGYTLPLVTDDRYGNKGVGSYKPVPFFMSSRGFGVWIDTFVPGSLDLSATERFVSRLRFPEQRLRVVFLAGPALTDVLDAYTALTGRTRVPPPWAFGLWKSRDVHHNQDSVLADVERLRRYGIPASVLVLDSP